MKKAILFLFAIVFFPKVILACSCILPTSFCEGVIEPNGIIYPDLILRGEIISSGSTTVEGFGKKEIAIDQIIYGDFNQSEISIQADLCTLDWGELEDGQEYIFSLKTFNDVYYATGCSIFFLKIEDEIVKGKIAPGIESIPYHELGSLESCGNALNIFSVHRDIEIFPNPTIDELKINNTSAIDNFENPALEIFDSMGRKLQIFRKATSILPKENWIVNIQHFSAGLYLVKIVGNHQEKTFKIVKQS